MSVRACQPIVPTTATAIPTSSCVCSPSWAALVVQTRNATDSSATATADPAHGVSARSNLLVQAPNLLDMPGLSPALLVCSLPLNRPRVALTRPTRPAVVATNPV